MIPAPQSAQSTVLTRLGLVCYGVGIAIACIILSIGIFWMATQKFSLEILLILIAAPSIGVFLIGRAILFIFANR